MSLFKCLLWASLVSQLLPAAHAEAHCPGNVTSLTLRLVQGALIVVPMEVNHSGPFDFVVDTGAQITTIDSSLALELHVTAQGTTGVAGVATSARAPFAYLDSIAAGDRSASKTLVVIQELSQLKAADTRIRGILGSNFLEHFDLLIDNSHQILCLDDSGSLASAVKGERITLADPLGSQRDLPFTRPILVLARLSSGTNPPVLLRLDSGSNVPVLYKEADKPSRGSLAKRGSILKRSIQGTEQAFAVLVPQDIQIGKRWLRQVPFVVPLTVVGESQAPREDGLLPTIALRRVFISCSRGYVTLEPWEQ